MQTLQWLTIGAGWLWCLRTRPASTLAVLGWAMALPYRGAAAELIAVGAAWVVGQWAGAIQEARAGKGWRDEL